MSVKNPMSSPTGSHQRVRALLVPLEHGRKSFDLRCFQGGRLSSALKFTRGNTQHYGWWPLKKILLLPALCRSTRSLRRVALFGCCATTALRFWRHQALLAVLDVRSIPPWTRHRRARSSCQEPGSARTSSSKPSGRCCSRR